LIKNKKSIVLGGTDDHIALIEILKQRGYYTILLDYHKNPPAKKVADMHIQESTLNENKVLQIAIDYKVDLIITACIDQALLTACYVAEKLGLPAPFDYETALNVTNKGYMKIRMLESGIPTSKHYFFDKYTDIHSLDLQYPVMVKPANSNGSFGVKKANTRENALKYLEEAIKISRTSQAIIEEYKEGIEVGIDCYLKNKKANLIMMGRVIKKPIDESTLLIYQTIIPANVSKTAKRKIADIVNTIAEVFNLDNTPLLLQTIVNGDEVNVIEFSPRVGGASKHRSVKMITGFDILSATVDSFLGITPVLNCHEAAHLYSRNHIYAKPSIFGYIKGHEELIREKVIEEFVFFKTKGMEIGPEMASKNRVGSFLVKAESVECLMNKVKEAVDRLEVFDIFGNPIMRKDIFEGEKI
jgi:carbamoylphosphate synthase large subunit